MVGPNVSPEYLAEIRRVAPQLGHLDRDDVVAMHAIGVTPGFIQELAAAGFRNLDEDELVEAKAIGVNGQYIRSMAAAGVRGSFADYVEMRALRITARDAARARALGPGALNAGRLVKMKTSQWRGHPKSSHVPEPPEPPEPPDDHGPDPHADD
jgi:hypothetical protein